MYCKLQSTRNEIIVSSISLYQQKYNFICKECIFSEIKINPFLIILANIHIISMKLSSRALTQLWKFSTQYPKYPNLSSKESTFHASQLIRQYRKQLLPLPDFNNPQSMPFGKLHTDHMITINYDIHTGWAAPKLQPFQDFQVSPFISGLHYGIQCYEGTKAYKNQKGEVRLFRPDSNALRFKKSSVRLTMPDFDGNELLKLIEELVRLEERWIPPKTEYSLYVRPYHFATDGALGVKKPDKTRLAIVNSPVGPYYSTGFKPVSLYCATETIRSAHKGTGGYKIGGNYGPTLQISAEVTSKGHQQVLWLLGQQIIEVGSSNIFFVFKDSNGQIQIVTPRLQDLILPGITRDSILELLKAEKQYKVTERSIAMTQVIDRLKKGQLLQIFGAGTAVIISSVNNIEYLGVNYPIPVDKKLNFGAISYKIRQKILDIQEGRAADPFGWVRRLK